MYILGFLAGLFVVLVPTVFILLIVGILQIDNFRGG